MLDARKNTYTTIGVFTIHAVFDPKSEAEERDAPHADHFQASFQIKPKDYRRAFEGAEALVKLPATEAGAYQQSLIAKKTDSGRTITMKWDNSHEEDTRKGELVISFDADGGFKKATMKKWANGTFGWDLVFDDEIAEATKDSAGLLLRDDEDLGYVTTDADIQTAVADPSPAKFRDLVEDN